jgi:hypothetical protein
MMFSRRGRASILIGLSLIASCGLENAPFLEPPPVSSPTSSVFGFRLQPSLATDGIMMGYEVYYRLYQSETDASADASSVAAMNSSNPTTVQQMMVSNLKYSRLIAKGGIQSIPLIRLSAAYSDQDVLLDFTNVISGNEPVLRFNDGATDLEIPLMRSVTDNGLVEKSFTAIGLNDQDLKKGTPTSGPKTLIIQAFVFSFGQTTDLQFIYSTAQSLGMLRSSLTYIE